MRLFLPPAFFLTLVHISVFGVSSLSAQTTTEPGAKPLLKLGSSPDLAAEGLKPNASEVTIAPAPGSGVAVTIQPGKDNYPAFSFTPKSGTWDLSQFGHIQARVKNTGAAPLQVSMRVDGRPDGGTSQASNTEGVNIKPGETKIVKVIFGFTYGFKPSAKPNPAAISGLVLFAMKSKAEQSFIVEAIEAAGPAGEKPPVNPADVRTIPEGGKIFGPGVVLDPAQIEAKDGAEAAVEGKTLNLTFKPGKTPPRVSIRPKIGRWDLRQFLEIKVKLKNTGTTPVLPKVQVGSNGGPTAPVKPAAPLAPGASVEMVVSFIPPVPWTGGEKLSEPAPGTGTKFTNDTVSAVTIVGESVTSEQKLAVESIVASVPPAPALPDWLGKRPPVEGDWTKTFEENFDGNKVDETKWNVYTENFWDKRSHFSKDNVIVADGVAKLHYEKKTGFHKDDPSLKKTDYATGFLDTYGKWVQRYGYFETRIKLPSAPGLWPAFWLMPDRGVQAGPQWKRANTGNGGMEFDVAEYLSRWGPYRMNVAWHWDGYGKEHKATGSTTIYFQPDKDGFVTSGVLWLPGLSVYYLNGKEVARWENPRVSNVESDIMFTHVSGGWDNNGIDDTKLPDDFVIDYVRAWQRKDLASEVDGAKKPEAPKPAEPAPPAQ